MFSRYAFYALIHAFARARRQYCLARVALRYDITLTAHTIYDISPLRQRALLLFTLLMMLILRVIVYATYAAT